MRVLVTSATGMTAAHVVPELLASGHEVRTLSRRDPALDASVEVMLGDMTEPAVIRKAVRGVDAVIHIGPTLHPREAGIGQSVIDAAEQAGVARMIFFSVLHPQVLDLTNHRSKLSVESHLVNKQMDWTILQPQHYVQNIDVVGAVKQGYVALPYSETNRLAFSDLADVAAVAARVVSEPGHTYATYELCSGQQLSTQELAASIAELSGTPIEALRGDLMATVTAIRAHTSPDAFDDHSDIGFRQIFNYYDVVGANGNANVTRWLLGREPSTWEDYVRRCLAGGRSGGGAAQSVALAGEGAAH